MCRFRVLFNNNGKEIVRKTKDFLFILSHGTLIKKSSNNPLENPKRSMPKPMQGQVLQCVLSFGAKLSFLTAVLQISKSRSIGNFRSFLIHTKNLVTNLAFL